MPEYTWREEIPTGSALMHAAHFVDALSLLNDKALEKGFFLTETYANSWGIYKAGSGELVKNYPTFVQAFNHFMGMLLGEN